MNSIVDVIALYMAEEQFPMQGERTRESLLSYTGDAFGIASKSDGRGPSSSREAKIPRHTPPCLCWEGELTTHHSLKGLLLVESTTDTRRFRTVIDGSRHLGFTGGLYVISLQSIVMTALALAFSHHTRGSSR